MRDTPRASSAAAAVEVIPLVPAHEPFSRPPSNWTTSSAAERPPATVTLPRPTSTVPPSATIAADELTTTVPFEARSVIQTLGPVVLSPHWTCRVGSLIALRLMENSPVAESGTCDSIMEL